MPMQTFTNDEVRNLIPHRWPFLLISSGVSADGKKATTEKYFGFWWWLACWLGHFTKFPLIPGVVFVELCAQLSALIIVTNKLAPDGLPTFASTKAKFIKPVQPFSHVYVEATFHKEKMGLFFFDCKVFNDAREIFCEIEIAGTSVPEKLFNKQTSQTTSESVGNH